MKQKQIFAFVGADEGEGIVAYGDSSGMMPLVCLEEKNLEIMRIAATQIAKATGKEIRILKFTACEQVGEIKP